MKESNPITRRDFSYANLVQQPSAYLKSASVQTREWVQAVINTMIADRLLSEVFDESDRRPRGDIRLYICEWFLKRFGNKEYAESLLKDFLLSLKKYGKINERFKIFCDLCDFEDFIDPDSD